MMRIWIGAFWSPPEVENRSAPVPVPRSGGPVLMVAPTAALVVCSLVIAAAAGPIYSFSERTAHDLLDRQSYIEEVLSPMRTFTDASRPWSRCGCSPGASSASPTSLSGVAVAARAARRLPPEPHVRRVTSACALSARATARST